MISFITILLFVVATTDPAVSNPFQTSENGNGLLRYMHRRSIGCYSGCSSSCSSCSQSYCASTCKSCISHNCCSSCCHNRCHICPTIICQQNYQCNQCCTQHCGIKNCCNNTTTTTTPSISTTTTLSPPTSTMPSTTVRPPYPHPPSNTSSNISVSNNVRNSMTNVINTSNNIRVPTQIHNINVLRNTITITGSGIVKEKEPEKEATTMPTSKTTTSTTITSTTAKTPEGKLIVINHYVHPIQHLPCFSYGCEHTRPYWNGQICDGWNYHGGVGFDGLWGDGYFGDGYLYGNYFGGGYLHGDHLGISNWGSPWWNFGSNFNWNWFRGCQSVYQDCSLCGSNFHSLYAYNSFQFSSCFGCFI